jgi:tellurite resistance protein
MLLVQLFILPVYARLRFSLGFWSFTFPLAAAGTYAIDWLAVSAAPGCRVGVLSIVGIVTVLVCFVAIRSLVLAWAPANGERKAETELAEADAAESH